MKKNLNNAETKKERKVRITANIKIVMREAGKILTTKTATSIGKMWKTMTELWAAYPTATAFISKDGQPFMKLHRVLKSNGKWWQINDIVESRRGHNKKTEEPVVEQPIAEPAQELHEITEAEEPVEQTVFAEA